jgi:hypothetical protein
MSSHDLVAAETRLFWCASSELRQAYADSQPADVIAFHLGEIETIAMHTDQPVLRQRSLEILDTARKLCPSCSFFAERQDSVA